MHFSCEGEKRKTWKRRFFVLTHDTAQLRFEYFKTQNGESLGESGYVCIFLGTETKWWLRAGSFSLKDALCFRVLEPPFSPFAEKPVAEVITPNRTYVFTADV